MKENVINLNKAMPKNKTDKQSLISRLAEFLIYVMSAAVIMYYLFKVVFGTPNQLKENNETIGAINSKIDSIYALQDLTYQGVNNLKDDQNEIKELINNNQIMIKENNEEITALKKVVNQKINTANQTINTQNRRIIELEQKNYNSLDSFFRARQNKNR
jgi:uncharacterized protein YoxC